MSDCFRRGATVLVFLTLFIVAAAAFPQFPVKIPKLPVSSPFEKESPLSTSLTDAVTEVPFLDDFDPQDLAPLSRLPRGPNNGFLIQEPGGYTLSAQSYCYHAGTHSPSRGKGYLYAPMKGTSADIIRGVLRRSVSHPNIPQQDVQALVWAILAQSKPSTMDPRIRSTADVLLTGDEVSTLEGSALDDVSRDLYSRALGKLPPQGRQVFEAERLLRDAVARSAPYSELERIAVLTGEPLPGKNDRPVPSGRWSYHPEGYFIRYYPDGYQRTVMDVYFPEDIAVKRDTKNRVCAIQWKDGHTLAIDYDDAIPPLAVNTYKGYPFKSVRLELKIPKNEKIKIPAELETARSAEWKDSGWTFAGAFGGRGRVAGENRYPNAAARYDSAGRQSEELKKLTLTVRSFDKSRKGRELPPNDAANLLGLMQLTSALKELMAANGVNREEVLFDPVELAQRAWAAELKKLVMSNEPNRVTQRQQSERPSTALAFATTRYLVRAAPMSGGEFNCEDGTASPGDTGRQRLGVSCRPRDDDNHCTSSYESCMNSSTLSRTECQITCSTNFQDSDHGLGAAADFASCWSACTKSFNSQNRKCAREQGKCQGKGR
jgi:hypothetical protein